MVEMEAINNNNKFTCFEVNPRNNQMIITPNHASICCKWQWTEDNSVKTVSYNNSIFRYGSGSLETRAQLALKAQFGRTVIARRIECTTRHGIQSLKATLSITILKKSSRDYFSIWPDRKSALWKSLYFPLAELNKTVDGKQINNWEAKNKLIIIILILITKFTWAFNVKLWMLRFGRTQCAAFPSSLVRK